ncbi:MAG: D-alanine--D-alanine ligase [Cyclobacteriaceae bacterium]
MEDNKINVAILFGGKSAEHEISLRSAKNVVDAIDKNKYNPILIGIDQQGRWSLAQSILESSVTKLANSSAADEVAMLPQSNGSLSKYGAENLGDQVDVVFPILHGPFGEDGTMQGLLKLANVPFVGAGVLGSAVGMDKDIMKKLLRDADLPIGKFVTARMGENVPSFEEVTKELGNPCFIKPANLGSSVGINRAETEEEYEAAVKEAFEYDNKIIIEEFIDGREIECAILGNEDPKASVVGEISFNDSFYSYDAKYIDEDGYRIDIPARISEGQQAEIQEVAIKTFKVLECEGFARVDVFLTKDNRILVNEINTIPGFTKISMYPKLWEASGIKYTDLIDKLIGLAIDRFKKEQRIKTTI